MKLPASVLVIISIMIGCTEDETKPQKVVLDYYEETFEIQDLGFQPQNKIKYEYDLAGRLRGYTFFSFDPATESMVEQRHFVFTYKAGNVDGIEGFLTNSTSPYIKYFYEYDGSIVKKIKENNYSAGINSEATFSYPSANRTVVSYQFSNGGSFEYEMNVDGNNIISDKTTRGSQLCSNGVYTYDQYRNPFNALGYVDYFLTNVSANNKLTEAVDYVGCAFPNLKPESYEYEYNSDGYPIEMITTYASVDEIEPRSIKKFFYKLR
jgi:hypothetical protein